MVSCADTAWLEEASGMAYFDWDPALETGHAEIDAQHRRLFALANALHEATEKDTGDEDAVADAVYGLVGYVAEHFADEEALMDACAYSPANWHKTLHRDLTAETMRFTARFMNDEDVTPVMLALFLVDWLQNHILKEDMRFVEFQRTCESDVP
jgi:hemerythrin